MYTSVWQKYHSFIYSLHKYLLSPNYVSDTVVDRGHSTEQHEVYILEEDVGKTTNK